STHPLIQAEDCGACHIPKNWPMKRLPREKILTLCLGCHKNVLQEQSGVQNLTKFRNNESNLHFIHGGDKNKIPCLTCHDGHGSNQLHLIRLRRTNSREALTIIYTATEKGGKCTASCHTTRSYERN
ncbi:MAG: cytochrome c3 family protein, partial [Deltaproteobacteria bacterium]